MSNPEMPDDRYNGDESEFYKGYDSGYKDGAHAMRCAISMWLEDWRLRTNGRVYATLRDAVRKLPLPIPDTRFEEEEDNAP
jgi:hypothetical protein